MGGFAERANGNSSARLANQACCAIVPAMPTLGRKPAPAGLVAVLSCAALLSSCGPGPSREEPAATNNIVQDPRPTPVVEAPLDRERLLLAAIRAASAFAAGSNDSKAQRDLDGKRFELRMRFGCGDGDDAARGWRFDEAKRTLRLRVTPDISQEDPVAAKVAGERYETVEGLWLRRPWLLIASCPAIPEPAPAEATGQQAPEPEPQVAQPMVRAARVGVAQFSSPTDSRTTRRKQRPYESTKILDEGQEPSRQGYDFVLSGRLRALQDRRVISCVSDRADAPPDCIISVHVDRSWIERADNRELVAEWTGG